MSTTISGWWWRPESAAGDVLDMAVQDFPTRSDAESWLGEFWQDLSDQGVESVTLCEGQREVYGPMSLALP